LTRVPRRRRARRQVRLQERVRHAGRDHGMAERRPPRREIARDSTRPRPLARYALASIAGARGVKEHAPRRSVVLGHDEFADPSPAIERRQSGLIGRFEALGGRRAITRKVFTSLDVLASPPHARQRARPSCRVCVSVRRASLRLRRSASWSRDHGFRRSRRRAWSRRCARGPSTSSASTGSRRTSRRASRSCDGERTTALG